MPLFYWTYLGFLSILGKLQLLTAPENKDLAAYANLLFANVCNELHIMKGSSFESHSGMWEQIKWAALSKEKSQTVSAVPIQQHRISSKFKAWVNQVNIIRISTLICLVNLMKWNY